MKKVVYVVVSIVLIVSVVSCYLLYKVGGSILLAGIKDQIEQKVRLEEKVRQEDSTNNVVSNDTKENKQLTNDDAQKNPNEKVSENKSAGAKSTNNQTKSGVKEPPKPNEEIKKIVESKIEEVKDSVTFEDKMAASAMVLKRLSSTEIKELNQMLKDGVSDEEKETAKKLVFEKFTPEEVEKIKKLYKKYLK